MTKSRLVIMTALCALVCGASALHAADNEILIASDGELLWLVRIDEPGKTFSVVARPAGRQWESIAVNRLGRPVTMAGVNGQLHVLFDSGGHFIFSQTSPSGAPGKQLPGRPVLACQAGELTHTGKALEVVSALHPIDANASGPIELYGYHQGQWSPLTALPEGYKSDDLADMCVVGRRVYVIVDAQGKRKLLWRQDGQWEQDKPKLPMAEGDFITMFDMGQRLVVVFISPGDNDARKLVFAILDEGSSSFQFQELVLDESARQILPGRPLAGRLAEHVAMVWPGKDQAYFATVNIDVGQFASPPHKVRLPWTAPTSRFTDVINYFTWMVVIAIFVPLFLLRPAGPPQPFALPPGVRPGNLLLRGAAVLLDLIPFILIAVIIFPPPEVPPTIGSLREFIETFSQLEESVNAAYATILAMILFTTYCSLMELRFGATLGKKLLRLRVVASEGKPPTPRQVVLRNMLKIIEIMMPLAPLLLLWPLLSRHRQRLGDMLAQTAIVDNRTLGIQTGPFEAADTLPPDDDKTDEE